MSEKMIEKADIKCVNEIMKVINKTNQKMYKSIIPKEHFKDPYISINELKQNLDEKIFYVFKYQDQIVGVIALEIVCVDSGKIHNLYVLPKFQNMGIGTALVIHLQNIAQSLGIRNLKLHVGEQADWAISFYSKLGYDIINKKERTWGITVVMAKELT